jgi:hypothetical protein
MACCVQADATAVAFANGEVMQPILGTAAMPKTYWYNIACRCLIRLSFVVTDSTVNDRGFGAFHHRIRSANCIPE